MGETKRKLAKVALGTLSLALGCSSGPSGSLRRHSSVARHIEFDTRARFAFEHTDTAPVEAAEFFIPVRKGRVSSTFGYRRNPFNGAVQFHRGVDIAVDTGTPVRACWGGRVESVEWSRGSGHQVRLSHAGGRSTVYKHLSAVRVARGRWVDGGDQVGASGNTGMMSTGPHLHLETIGGGKPLDPGRFDSRLARKGSLL